MDERRALCFVMVSLIQIIITTQSGAAAGSFHVDHGPIYEIMIHPDNGDVFLGTKNALLHLSSNLHVIRTEVMGPQNDSPQCSPDLTQACLQGRKLTDNRVNILEFDGQTGYMLVCGSIWQGKCELRNSRNISHKVTLTNSKINFVGSIDKKKVYGFFGSRPVGGVGGGSLLYVAMGLDGKPSQYRPAAISTREYHTKDKTFEYFISNLNYHTYVDVHPDLRNKFKAHYIYGFEHGRHIYFISIQMEDGLAPTPKFLTKIIQICRNDTTYASYTELPLQCVSDSVVYNIAIDAYYTESVRAKDGSFGLAVTFGRTNRGSEADATLGSALCFYDVIDIIAQFEYLQNRCFEEGIGSQVTWLVGKSLAEVRNCEKDEKYDMRVFCGSMSNIGIQESATSQNRDTFKLSSGAVYVKRDGLLTSVVMARQNTARIAVLGTNGGQVTKVLLTGNHYLASWNVTDKAIYRESEVDISHRNVFFIADQTLYKFPLYTCDAYHTCEKCVGSGDPAGCGWCVDHCSTSTECVNPTVSSSGQTGQWQNDTCPPIISQVLPSVGPTQGQTLLTLKGRNFGSEMATVVKVTFNGRTCKIEGKTMDTKLQCRTPASQTPGTASTASLSLTVNDFLHTGYKIVGTAVAEFQYQVPVIDDISPSLGPISGGTELTVHGRNLDIGTNVAIFIGEDECSVQRKNSSAILCLTGRGMSSSGIQYKTSDLLVLYPSLITAAPVRVQIDGSNTTRIQMFAYVNDSTISSIQSKTSIVNGGLEIDVRGTNLNVVQRPQIGATVDGKDSHLLMCKATADGTRMSCPTPGIQNLTSEPVDPNFPKLVSIWFKMDGIRELRELEKHDYALSRFTYYPNPTFEPFGSVRLFDLSEDLLSITGKHIDKGITPKDVIVTIGESLCVVKLLKSNKLFCQPQNKPSETDNEPQYKVQVKIGVFLIYDVGSLQYVGGASTAPPTLIIVISIVLVVFLVLIIILLIVMKRKHLGPFKERGYTAGYANGQGQVRLSGLNPDGTTFDFERDNRANDYQERHLSASRDDTMDSARGGGPTIVLDESTLLVLRDKNLLIEHDWLSMGEILGRGHFGCVYKGYITYPGSKTETMVAVKTLHQNNPREIDINQFIDEALRMKDFHHPNVLTLTGICFNYDAMPLVILPYMSHGDLLSYIRNEDNNPTIKDLILFAVDIAKGMEYLSLLKVVHRDLACRNCMLNEEYRAIVADFGLSRDIYERDYYSSDNKKSKLPVKWMAPESLEKGTYSSKSDVWSFGVVLWELMTRGVNPYPEVDNWDVLRYIKKNRRMPQPPFCPDPLYAVMRNCWEFDPKDRPQFSVLVTSIAEMLSVLEHKMKQGQQRSNIQSTYVNVENCTEYHYGNQDEEENSPLASPIQTDV